MRDERIARQWSRPVQGEAGAAQDAKVSPQAAERQGAGVPAIEPFDKVVFVGVGLINGSLARDMRRLGLARRLVGVARRQETLARAHALGLVDEVGTDVAEAVSGADLVVLGVPVGAMQAAAAAIAPVLRADAIVTDVGSVKAEVVAAVAPVLDPACFVPGHPVAGTEHSGPEAAVKDLFRDRWCILTPTAETARTATDRVAGLWHAVGANVEVMTPAHHDRVLAITSHLPHLLAFNAVNVADALESVLRSEVLKYAAGGFTDFTRIAASDPTLWRDVFLNNREAVLEVVRRYLDDLSALERTIASGDGERLLTSFSSARDIRRNVVLAGQAYERRPLSPERRS